MNSMSRIFLVGLMIAGLSGLQACSNDGPMEEAGEQVDEALDEAADNIEDACEDLTDSNC